MKKTKYELLEERINNIEKDKQRTRLFWPNKFNEWITVVWMVILIFSTSFAGVKKYCDYIFSIQFDKKISGIEFNINLLDEKINAINKTVDRIWTRIK